MISRALKFDVFAKSFFIQAAWNAERMQNIGFLFALRRSLKQIWEDDTPNFEAACARASSFFNTHPYFAPAVMGVALHLEEKIAAGLVLPERIEEAKSRISAPLNALGSLWFWDHLKFLALLATLPFLLMKDPVMIAVGAIGMFLFFNFFHLRTRWVGLELGLRYGEDMVPDLLRMFPSLLLQSFRRISVFMLGLCAPLLIAVLFDRLQDHLPGILQVHYLPSFFFPRIVLCLLFMAAVLIVLYKRWVSVYVLLAVCLALAIGVARWA